MTYKDLNVEIESRLPGFAGFQPDGLTRVVARTRVGEIELTMHECIGQSDVAIRSLAWAKIRDRYRIAESLVEMGWG